MCFKRKFIRTRGGEVENLKQKNVRAKEPPTIDRKLIKTRRKVF
jgi:hypothetical protein